MPLDRAERCRRVRERYRHETAPPSPASETRPSASATVRNLDAKDGFAELAGLRSLYEVFEQSVRKYAQNDCLGWRKDGGPYVWENYKALGERVAACASAMAHVGVGAHACAGVYAANSPQWMTVLQACNRRTVYTVPLYDTLGGDAVQYILQHSECCIVFLSTAKWQRLASVLPSLRGTLKSIVYWGPDAVERKIAMDHGMSVYSYEEFLELGRAHPADPLPPEADDLCTIMYTSGTTGQPKGVMLTHRMVMHCIAAQERIGHQADGLEPGNEKDIFLSWLPLSHIMDRSAEEFMLFIGARIGYWQGRTDLLLEDIQALRPTIFIAPPRVWDRVVAGAQHKINQAGPLRKMLFEYAYNYKLHYLKEDVQWDKAAPFFDRLIFSKIGAALGGRVRLALSGSAPLAPHIEEFLRVCLCSFFSQGYGLTETCAASFYSSSSEWESFGTVGVPAATHDYRLESIPEMKYDALGDPPQGEICIKGPIVFKGYYKDPQKTAEVLDADGWFHTGDVGQIEESGALKIIDRKKQIFKLSQGEYIAPEKVEAVYNELQIISQIFVHGYSTESKLVAVVVPEEVVFVPVLRAESFSGSFAELMQDPKVKEVLLQKMDAKGRQAGLQGFELVKGIILEHELFAIENGLLTPTMKLKRQQLLERYKPDIDQIYAELKEG